MLLLAFDTSSPAVTVAVHDGVQVLGRASGEGAIAHGELLAPAIDDALRQAGARPSDLTDVAVGVGPGPFTGLRVGVVTALTLASTLGLRSHGVCSLDILAQDVRTEADTFLVATDARRKEVYWALYDSSARRIEGPGVDRPDAVARLHSSLPAIGRGASLYPGELRATPGPQDPSAEALASGVVAGRFIEVPLEPVYLRRPDVTMSAAPKRA
jgi:tRNA threonylcarbamoyl adenosine modification protein YeaZ